MPTNELTTSFWRRVAAVSIVLLIVLVLSALAGCGASPSRRGELADNQAILSTCDPATPPGSLVEIDGTGSSNADNIVAERMAATESVVRRTAVCSGVLRVTVFSSSSAATSVLFDGSLKADGATDNAKLKKVPGIVSEAMSKIRAAYGPALAALPQNGSDVTAQLRLASEWIGQVGGNFRLHLYVLSDGFQNIGVDLGARPLSKLEAQALAGRVDVPKLTGASVTVAGLGRVVGTPPPSSVVEGLVAYYDALCARTAAVRCVSVTDFAVEGR